MLDLHHGEFPQALPGSRVVGLSEPVSGRTVLLGLSGPDALAEGGALPEVSEAYGSDQNPQSVSVQEVLAPSVGHGRDDVSQEPDSVAKVVLGDLLDGELVQGDFHAEPAEAFGD